MKYITFLPQGTKFPVAVLFTPTLMHSEIARALEPLGMRALSAGFVTIPATAAYVGGFSPSLKLSPTPIIDERLILHSLQVTAQQFPPPPSGVAALRPEERAAVRAQKPA